MKIHLSRSLATAALIAFACVPAALAEVGYLASPSKFPVVIGGKTVGSTTLALGTKVEVLRQEGGKTLVKTVAGEAWLDSGQVVSDLPAQQPTPTNATKAPSSAISPAPSAPVRETQKTPLPSVKDDQRRTERTASAGAAKAVPDIPKSDGPWQWVINPRFDEALPFASDGLALVRLGDKWGLIDKAGKQVLECRYDEIKHFPEANCAALRVGDNWGLADGLGKVVLKPEWEEVGPLIRDLIPVKRDGKWGYADASGKLVIQPAWDDAWRFSPAGTAVVTIANGRVKKRGFIDKTGSVITPIEWDGAINHVAEGIGAVRRGLGWALVDKTGKVLCEPEWDMQWRLLRADLGFLPVRKNDMWGILGLDGKVIADPEWPQMAPAKSGVLLAKPGAPAIFIGAGGKKVFETGPLDEIRGSGRPNWFVEVEGFSDGRLAVCAGGKWGFIDEKGAFVIKPRWDGIGGFSEGWLAVRSGDKWGFVDEKDNVVIEPKWDDVGRLSEGLFAVHDKARGETWDFLNPDGTLAISGNKDGIEIIAMGGWPPRFRNGYVEAWSNTDRCHVRLNHQGKVTDRKNRLEKKPWLPEGVAIKGIYFQHTSRYGRDGYMRNFANDDGKILMRDVPIDLESLKDPFPYPGPPRYGLARAEDGKVLVEPSWDLAEFAAPGWVRIWVNDRAGLVNRDGKTVLAPEWDSVELTYSGLIIATKDGATSHFDGEGKALLPNAQLPGAQYVDFYGKGFIAKSQRPDGSVLWSLCDPTAGAPVSYENAERVYWTGDMADNGLLWIKERGADRWSLIKRDGNPLGISQSAKPEGWFIREGFTVLKKDDRTAVHIDAAGRTLGDTSWEDARLFSNGLAAVKSGGKWGFIDTTGRIVIPAEWDGVGNFRNEGTKDAPVLIADVNRGGWANGLWGCINSEGRIVIEPFCDRTPRDGTAGIINYYVRRTDNQGLQAVYFKPDGTPLDESAAMRMQMKAELEQARPATDGAVIKTIRRKPGIYDTEGKVLLKPVFKCGLYDTEDRALIEPTWDKIAWVGPGSFAAWNKSDGGIFDTKGQAVFRDDAARRLARFGSWGGYESGNRYMQGLVLIEAPPVWGYAKFPVGSDVKH